MKKPRRVSAVIRDDDYMLGELFDMYNELFDVVTGALGYTGRHIARRLLSMGRHVKNLTGHPDRSNPFDRQILTVPFSFHDPEELADTLRGASTVFNTYWIRFPYRGVTFETAINNTKVLIDAARKAGVARFVHVSITNPSEDSPLDYFRGKATVERVLAESGLSHAIIRPTVVFGREDVLINNIAWLLRRFPVFCVPGSGEYRLQPIFVEDLAEIAVSAAQGNENIVIDAVGPDVFTFNELVGHIGEAVGSKARIIHLPSGMAVGVAKIIGWFLGDVILTHQEAEGLMSNLLISDKPPTGKTQFIKWLTDHSGILGRRYASELAIHYR